MINKNHLFLINVMFVYRLYEEDRNPQQSILLREHYDQPRLLEGEENLDSLLRGLATQSSQKLDLHYSKTVSS